MMKWLPQSINMNTVSYFDYLFYMTEMLKQAPKTNEAHPQKMTFGGK